MVILSSRFSSKCTIRVNIYSFDFEYVVKKHKSAMAVKFLLLNLSTTTTTTTSYLKNRAKFLMIFDCDILNEKSFTYLEEK